MKKDYDNRIELTGHMRQLLLAEICRHDDVIFACNMDQNLQLVNVYEADYLGTCPWCGEKKCFTMNKISGSCHCSHCGEQGDYLDLVCMVRNEDLADTLKYISDMIKIFDYSEARRRREKEAASKWRHEEMLQLQGGLL